MRVDRAVAAELIARVQPLGVEAALSALKAFRIEQAEKRRPIELALKQARHEAARARQQYDVVDPENRLVPAELERRWNERLRAVRELVDEQEGLVSQPPTALTASERAKLMEFGADLARAWQSPGATAATRKRIIRTLVGGIAVGVEAGALALVIRNRSAGTTPGLKAAC